MDQKLIGALLRSREAYEKVFEHLDDKDLVPEARLCLEEIRDYYERDPDAERVDHEILAARIESKVQGEKHVQALRDFLRAAVAADVSPENIVSTVLEVKRNTIALKLAAELATGRNTAESRVLLEQYTSLMEATDLGTQEEEELHGLSVAALVEKHDPRGLIKIAPKALNDKLDGGAKPGHHILVFAPTEMGKTLFVINMTYAFLQQGLPVLYVGNEDPAEDIIMRLVSRSTGMTKHEVLASPDEAGQRLNKANYDLFTLAALAPGTFPAVRRLVLKYRPRVVILDQLRNMDVKSDNRTNQLERAATEARNLAKRHKLVVVSVAQAADSATGKRILRRGDVDSSNVGIPGQVDLMLGIGADEDMEERGLRMLSLPKNKLSGDHRPLAFTVNPALSKVEV